MMTRTALVPTAAYRPPSRWPAGTSASIRQVDWDLAGPIITVTPLSATTAMAAEPESVSDDAPAAARRGLILDILV